MKNNILNLDNELSKWADNVIKRIRKSMVDNDINASGETSKSLEYDITDDGVVILGAPYFAERTEVGRTPTKNHYSWDFTSVIAKWIIDKDLETQFNIKNDRELRGMAFVISRNISKLGSSKYRGTRPRTDVYSTIILEEIENVKNIAANITYERLNGMLDEEVREIGDKVGNSTKINPYM